jgi:uncharacterized membrane protein
MATERQRRILGYAGLGLLLGIVLFAVFYIVTFRAGISERFTWSWVFIHLLVLFAPAGLFALYGANKTSTPI